ncbi:hypothetical protein BDV10DRAFT_81583 [Aspergillus recurvatus]
MRQELAAPVSRYSRCPWIHDLMAGGRAQPRVSRSTEEAVGGPDHRAVTFPRNQTGLSSSLHPLSSSCSLVSVFWSSMTGRMVKPSAEPVIPNRHGLKRLKTRSICNECEHQGQLMCPHDLTFTHHSSYLKILQTTYAQDEKLERSVATFKFRGIPDSTTRCRRNDGRASLHDCRR